MQLQPPSSTVMTWDDIVHPTTSKKKQHQRGEHAKHETESSPMKALSPYAFELFSREFDVLGIPVGFFCDFVWSVVVSSVGDDDGVFEPGGVRVRYQSSGASADENKARYGRWNLVSGVAMALLSAIAYLAFSVAGGASCGGPCEAQHALTCLLATVAVASVAYTRLIALAIAIAISTLAACAANVAAVSATTVTASNATSLALSCLYTIVSLAILVHISVRLWRHWPRHEDDEDDGSDDDTQRSDDITVWTTAAAARAEAHREEGWSLRRRIRTVKRHSTGVIGGDPRFAATVAEHTVVAWAVVHAGLICVSMLTVFSSRGWPFSLSLAASAPLPLVALTRWRTPTIPGIFDGVLAVVALASGLGQIGCGVVWFAVDAGMGKYGPLDDAAFVFAAFRSCVAIFLSACLCLPHVVRPVRSWLGDKRRYVAAGIVKVML